MQTFNDFATYVIRNTNTVAYYKSRLPEWDGRSGSVISCPFHEDKTPSFSVNIGTMGGCYCHAAKCNKKIGSIVHLEKELNSYENDRIAAQKIYQEFIHPVIEFDGGYGNLVTTHRSNLLDKSPDLLKVLESELGFSFEQIEKFNIGFDWESKRFTFPVFNQWGDLLNIRYYKAPSQRTGSTKFKIYNHEGFGSPAVLYPLDILECTPIGGGKIYWMKAERDVILAWSLGIPAFCSTGGEGHDNKPFMPYLKKLGLKVVVVGDNDEAGKLAVEKKLQDLENSKIPCARVDIPETQKDFSDWIMEEGKFAPDFYSLPEISHSEAPLEFKTKQVIHLPKGMIDATLNPLEGEYEVSSIGRRPELLNCAIQVKGVVSAKLDRTYSIPNVIADGDKLYRIPISRELLQLVGVSDKAIYKILSGLIGTQRPLDFRQFITVTEVEIIPVLVPGVDATYVTQRCFYFGENLESNLPYNLSIIPTSSMKTQETVGLIYEATPISSVLDHVKITSEDAEELTAKFAVPANASAEAVFAKILDLSLEIANKHTLIYNRIDIHMIQLLSWCSPIQFNFHCEGIQRGWINALILGDTQTGKSQVANGLRDLFGCGAFLNSENCTFVGLIGGAIKCASGSFMLRWGKIPLYNRQLVVLEELSGLTTEEISNMSDVRSSGVARLDKGGLSGETSAKTRLLCLSNVRRKYSNLRDYPHGVKAVQELIGQNEDVSRFDLILTATDTEVSNDIINQDRSKQSNILYGEEERALFRKLIMFIWSLKPEQIEITDAAYSKSLELTLELSKIYHASVPIFKAGSGRLKLARIACAIAALQFSWDHRKGKLIVRDTHVKAASMILKKFYNKPSLGYGKYSKQQFLLDNVSNETKLNKTVETIFSNPVTRDCFFRYLANNGAFEKEELNQALNLTSIYVERLISVLLMSNVIRKSVASYRLMWEVTPPGRKWIDKHYTEK